MDVTLLHIHKMNKNTQSKTIAHSHDYWQLEIDRYGIIQAKIEDKEIQLRPGDMLLVGPGLCHEFIYEPPGMSLLSLKFDMKGDIHIGNNILINRTPFTARIVSSLEVLAYSTILDEYEKKFIEGHISSLLHYLSSEKFKNQSSTTSQIILDITAHIKSRNGKSVTIDELAEIYSYSRSHLSKMFKKQFGESLKSYIDRIRLEKAKEMLSYSELTISGIAEELDFKDIYSFSRFFKQHTSISPKEYRK